MSKWIVGMCIVLGLVLPTITSASALRDYLFPTKVFSGGTTIILDKLKGLYIIKPKARQRTFVSSGTTAATLGDQHPTATSVVNASYFGYTNKAYFPAGHTSQDPTLIDTTHCDRDRNLCGYIFTDTLAIHESLTSTAQPTISGGPVLLRAGKINKAIDQRYSHRQNKTKRTVLLNTSRGNFFVLTKKGYTLPDLAAYLLKTFGPATTAINLDGGTSTSLWSRDTGFSLSSTEKLPTYFILE